MGGGDVKIVMESFTQQICLLYVYIPGRLKGKMRESQLTRAGSSGGTSARSNSH